MLATILYGAGDVRCEEVAEPKILHPTDAIIRLSASCICGSDLWPYHPQIRVHHIGRENLLPLVALNRGLTVVSEAMTAALFPGVAYRPIIGEVLPFSAVWSLKNDNPALRQLLDLARSMSSLRDADVVTRPVSQIDVSAGPSQSRDRLQ